MYYLYGVLDYDLESDDLVGVIRSCFALRYMRRPGTGGFLFPGRCCRVRSRS